MLSVDTRARMDKVMSILIVVWAAALIWVIPQPMNLSMQLFGLAVVFVTTQISAGVTGRS